LWTSFFGKWPHTPHLYSPLPRSLRLAIKKVRSLGCVVGSPAETGAWPPVAVISDAAYAVVWRAYEAGEARGARATSDAADVNPALASTAADNADADADTGADSAAEEADGDAASPSFRALAAMPAILGGGPERLSAPAAAEPSAPSTAEPPPPPPPPPFRLLRHRTIVSALAAIRASITAC
jgi:hypothetical protein